MKNKILIYGAGAIGRGYLPWIFPSDDYELSFVENNKNLRGLLRENKMFTTFRTRDNKYEKLLCRIKNCFELGEENTSKYDAIITAVGPRQVLSLKDTFKNTKCPVVLFENDSRLSGELRELTGKDNIFFGVPDVITSNTAPKDLIEKDPLSIVTETGVCFVDDDAISVGGDISYVSGDELRKQWLAKLYIHNTPHCIAAYLGALSGRKYLHEGMGREEIYSIVEGAMWEMSQTIVKLYGLDEEFVNWYSQKELSRFSNVILYDPISRVAREPFRKLGLDDRLIGAAQLSLSVGVLPENLILGIMAAFLYDEKKDNDFHIKILMNSLPREKFLKLIINVNPHEALYKYIISHWDKSLEKLKGIRNG